MGIRYSGTVLEITSDIETALARLAAGQQPPSSAVGAGTIEVRPVDAKTDLRDGTFSLTVQDIEDPHGFRFLVRAQLADRCLAVRPLVAAARRELEIAIRDGASQNTINALEAALRARQRELDNCERGAGIPGVDFQDPLRAFRSSNLFRTAIEDVALDNMQIFVRILTAADVAAVNRIFGTSIPTLVSPVELNVMIQQNLPPSITVTSVTTRGGRVHIEFTSTLGPLEVNGSMAVAVEPSVSYDFRQLISLRLKEFDLKGVLPSIAQALEKQIRQAAETAITQTEAQFNNGLDLSRLLERDGSITLLSVVEEVDGLRISSTIGFLLGTRKDQCQGIRDEIIQQTRQVRIAKQDGLSQDIINQMNGELIAMRNRLQQCREATEANSAPDLGPVAPVS